MFRLTASPWNSPLRIVTTDGPADEVSRDGFTIYTPRDAYMYVTLSEHDRRLLHAFKKRFGGRTEWNPTNDGPRWASKGRFSVQPTHGIPKGHARTVRCFPGC